MKYVLIAIVFLVSCKREILPAIKTPMEFGDSGPDGYWVIISDGYCEGQPLTHGRLSILLNKF